MCNRLGRRIRQIVDREDDDVIAHSDTAIRAPIALEGRLTKIDAHFLYLS
jgi:hypothetical protein